MKQGDRVRSRVTGNLGTVTQAGQREGFVHVLFDGATDAICFDTGSLEPDWESQVAALSAERDALVAQIADVIISQGARIAALESDLSQATRTGIQWMERAERAERQVAEFRLFTTEAD